MFRPPFAQAGATAMLDGAGLLSAAELPRRCGSGCGHVRQAANSRGLEKAEAIRLIHNSARADSKNTAMNNSLRASRRSDMLYLPQAIGPGFPFGSSGFLVGGTGHERASKRPHLRTVDRWNADWGALALMVERWLVPLIPFPSYKLCASDRPGAVKGARFARRSEPLTARTDLESYEGEGKGILQPSSHLPTKGSAHIRVEIQHKGGPSLGVSPERSCGSG